MQGDTTQNWVESMTDLEVRHMLVQHCHGNLDPNPILVIVSWRLLVESQCDLAL